MSVTDKIENRDREYTDPKGCFWGKGKKKKKTAKTKKNQKQAKQKSMGKSAKKIFKDEHTRNQE